MGADNLKNFHKWKNWKKVPKLATVVVFARQNYPFKFFSSNISKKLNIYKIDIFSDSELLVKQINLEYKVKNERLKKLHTEARDKLYNSTWKLAHIRREKNRKADFLSKKGLDEGPKK